MNIVSVQYIRYKTLTNKVRIWSLGLPASARLWQAGVSLLFFPRILIN